MEKVISYNTPQEALLTLTAELSRRTVYIWQDGDTQTKVTDLTDTELINIINKLMEGKSS